MLCICQTIVRGYFQMTSKVYLMTSFTKTVAIFQVAWSLPVCLMVAHKNFQEDLMTFFFDKSFKQAMESNSKTCDKQSVVILLHQSKIILVKTQNSSTTHKNH